MNLMLNGPVSLHILLIFTTIGKRGYMSGILHIPGLYQGSHQRSFTFFGWYISGIPYTTHIPAHVTSVKNTHVQ